MSTHLLDRNTVKALMKMSDVVNVVEEAFGKCGEGRGKMPAKVYPAVEHADFRAMPAALVGFAGMKWVNVHPQNPSRGLPSMQKAMEINESSS